MRLYARDNTHALRSSEWIQLDASWSCSHSCLKTSADIFLQTCHPVLPWGPCCPLKWTQKAVRLEQKGGGGEGWRVDFAIRLEELWRECNQRSHWWWCSVRETEWAPQGNSLMKRMLSTCHMLHEKKSLFHVGGWSTSSVCVPVSKGEAEHLREKFKSTGCKKHLRVISQKRDCRNQKHTKGESRNESRKIFLPCCLGYENCLD